MLSAMLWSGCGLHPPLHEQRVGELGYLDFRKPDGRLDGVVIGAPFGLSEPDAVDYATTISDETGAGLVAAYGFRSKRVTVEQPLVYTAPHSVVAVKFSSPGSVYPEFGALLRDAADGPLKFYVGVRVVEEINKLARIEVATSGLTFEQIKALKETYFRLRDRELGNSAVPKVDVALNPLDDVSWNVTGVKNHGVLMLAEKGLVLQLPHCLGGALAKSVYAKILTEWVTAALSTSIQNPSHLPEIQINLTPYGRIETLARKNNPPGVVIGAPHGSFDRHTAELVQELSYRTGLAAVIAKGFTPTEAGGWRINVNWPTEKSYPMGEQGQEKNTDRARIVFQDFSDAVSKAARGPLEFYFDFHQNSQEENIDVATVGITARQAEIIKSAYREIRDGILTAHKNVPSVNLIIEPVDKVTFGARVAKEQGILRLAKRALHLEMPAHRVFYDPRTRHVYTAIFAELMSRIAAVRFFSTATGGSTLAANGTAP